MRLSEIQIIDIFKALSDPNRMQIFRLLLFSDRTNSELMEETGLRQNLLSHHLHILTDCDLIEVRRSIGDARRHYYTPQFSTVRATRDWWTTRTAPTAPTAPTALPVLPKRVRVLFLCFRNGARSFIAEALARENATEALIVESAGIETPTPDLEYGRMVLAEHQITLDGFEPKTYQALADQPFDYVVTVCDIVHERDLLAGFPDTMHVHWSLPDPMDAPDDAGRMAITRRIYDEITLRLANFVQQLTIAETDTDNT
ncbi:MAG: metalloregulator ArsR/SmtB family transcription factor [Anaerolineae bacterium]|nr:metalloregulator ArsR/SmtB family transcription factor [Anaerolineae bacterium]